MLTSFICNIFSNISTTKAI